MSSPVGVPALEGAMVIVTEVPGFSAVGLHEYFERLHARAAPALELLEHGDLGLRRQGRERIDRRIE